MEWKFYMKIYDCFTFFNEVELLNFRLDYLVDVVDWFVITEGATTFSGKEKPQNFSLDLVRNEQVKKKIRYYHIDFNENAYKNKPLYQELDSETACWQREEYQRDSLARGLFDAQPEDILFLTDIDEIPNRQVVMNIKDQHQILDSRVAVSLEMDHFYGSIFNRTQLWYHPKVVKFKEIRNRFSIVRLGGSEGVIRSAGWHFTSFGGKDRLVQKVQSFSHTSAAKEENLKDILKKLDKENYSLNSYNTELLPELVFSQPYKEFFTG